MRECLFKVPHTSTHSSDHNDESEGMGEVVFWKQWSDSKWDAIHGEEKVVALKCLCNNPATLPKNTKHARNQVPPSRDKTSRSCTPVQKR